jgi:Zn-finger nucleic acid-binding protein
MEMTCPKCRGVMRNYERNGVHIDQCVECRGIFLDRGELERLVDAENSWHSGQSQQQPSQQSGGSGLGGMVGQVMQQAQGHRQGHGQQHGYGDKRKKKKESFLEDLFG